MLPAIKNILGPRKPPECSMTSTLVRDLWASVLPTKKRTAYFAPTSDTCLAAERKQVRAMIRRRYSDLCKRLYPTPNDGASSGGKRARSPAVPRVKARTTTASFATASRATAHKGRRHEPAPSAALLTDAAVTHVATNGSAPTPAVIPGLEDGHDGRSSTAEFHTNAAGVGWQSPQLDDDDDDDELLGATSVPAPQPNGELHEVARHIVAPHDGDAAIMNVEALKQLVDKLKQENAGHLAHIKELEQDIADLRGRLREGPPFDDTPQTPRTQPATTPLASFTGSEGMGILSSRVPALPCARATPWYARDGDGERQHDNQVS